KMSSTRLVVISNGVAAPNTLYWTANSDEQNNSTTITLQPRAYADPSQVWVLKNDGTSSGKNTIINVGNKSQKVWVVTAVDGNNLCMKEYNSADIVKPVQQFIITTPSKPGVPVTPSKPGLPVSPYVIQSVGMANQNVISYVKPGVTIPELSLSPKTDNGQWIILPIIN
ncbi:2547_t:CDS:1, partial [Paraglomus occultum]